MRKNITSRQQRSASNPQQFATGFPSAKNISLVVLILATFLSAFQQPARAEQAVVRAVLFFSPTCSHCHSVMEEVLPPLVDKYSDQLDIAGIDVSQQLGQTLYQSYLFSFNVPDERLGVPTLVIGEIALVGSDEIENQLPAIIEKGLAGGGVSWPNIPGLQGVLDAQPATTGDQNAPDTPQSTQPVFIQRFLQDPLANSIAVVVLVVMLVCLAITTLKFIQGSASGFLNWPSWVIPLLAILGMGVAGYLSYVEITSTSAVCGPVGNCNSVQESPYAYLFGVIPIGALGLVGYASTLAAWLFQLYGPASLKKFFNLAIWGMAWFGVLFSIYLTFLEPFVIGATCAWCISSAIIMTLMLLASTGPAMQAMQVENDDDEDWEMVIDDGAPHQEQAS